MKRELRGFVSGLLVMLLISSTVLAAPVTKTIEVVFNKVNLTVNGVKVNADNILYNGTTYVPLRAAAEALGKEVGWDQATNTASINDKKEQTATGNSNDVAAKIKAKAEKDWPGDFAMQKYEIDRQTKAYNTLKELPNTADYKADILKKAIAEWPDDYAMQVYEYERQLKAYKEINQ